DKMPNSITYVSKRISHVVTAEYPNPDVDLLYLHLSTLSGPVTIGGLYCNNDHHTIKWLTTNPKSIPTSLRALCGDFNCKSNLFDPNFHATPGVSMELADTLAICGLTYFSNTLHTRFPTNPRHVPSILDLLFHADDTVTDFKVLSSQRL